MSHWLSSRTFICVYQPDTDYTCFFSLNNLAGIHVDEYRRVGAILKLNRDKNVLCLLVLYSPMLSES